MIAQALVKVTHRKLSALCNLICSSRYLKTSQVKNIKEHHFHDSPSFWPIIAFSEHPEHTIAQTESANRSKTAKSDQISESQDTILIDSDDDAQGNFIRP